MDTIPDPEVKVRPTRRRFAVVYKVVILAELGRATALSAKGAIIRRESLYSSHIADWRRLRALGRAPGPRLADPLVAENGRLRDTVGHLETRLSRAVR